MLPIHPIKYGRGMQNVRRRAYKIGTSFNRQIAYWQTVNENARGIQYAVAFSMKLLKFQAEATLNEPAIVKVINFQVVVKRKGLVGSSYSSAVEISNSDRR